ncbi:MAG: NAD(P)H-hydrate dehydratase [Clostridiales bacterium]|uniref:NAD(P)H-hydrate dehydratase n=1 Tax=Provencibacterium massiliense TaxID=1841868 RepID=UPI0009A763D6|nr:NAD(P)H-hydrate dehydratase [Provencibacterium massiliense]PWM38477.1 MAG: NAD(P)H-hydrate dehydratase [Clostridiales bacterium]RGB69793.1 NAD(P)H-hydrate dehydratase [Harryflintia acetispora]
MRTLLDEKTVYSHIPPKADDLHKGSAGKLYLVAGSRSFRGAAVLATMGALRSGCGYVSLASTPEVCNNISHHLITPTLSVLPENAEGRISRSAAQTVLREAAGYGAMVLGCGLGLDADTEALVRGVLPHFEGPLVLDADGINALAHGIDILREAPAKVILTPHEGEMARLCRSTIEAVHRDREGAARTLAKDYGVWVVLKGPHTLIASPDGQLLENTSGNSGLAKGGSGDILSGMIGSLLAQGLDPLWAAACGVYLHGAAADLTARRMSRYCMQPPDLLDDLPEIFIRNGR